MIMKPGVLFIAEAILDQVVEHARAGKPQEVCGIMRGRDERVVELVRGRNVAPDPVMDYVVDAQTLLRQFDFEEDGDEMTAIYHSHPVSPAYPSASDAWNAHYPDSAYLICSLENDAAPVVRAYRMFSHPTALDLNQLRATLDFDETRPGRFAFYQAADTPLPSVLQPTCSDLPVPFYIVFEMGGDSSKDLSPRVVSIQELEILPGSPDIA
jgi:proteasome lid subunit RPN8/RPN11